MKKRIFIITLRCGSTTVQFATDEFGIGTNKGLEDAISQNFGYPENSVKVFDENGNKFATTPRVTALIEIKGVNFIDFK